MNEDKYSRKAVRSTYDFSTMKQQSRWRAVMFSPTTK